MGDREFRALVAALRPGFLKSRGQAQRLDVTFNEDASRIRKDNAPLNFSVLRRLSLNLLGRDTSVRGSIAMKRYRAGLDNNYLVKLIATV